MPKPKTIAFAPKLRLWPETVTDIETRLRRFLLACRRKRLEAASREEGTPAEVSCGELSGRRSGQGTRPEPPEDEDDLPDLEDTAPAPRSLLIELNYTDEERIRRRARRLVRAREEASGVRHLRKEDVDRLRPVAGGVTLAGPASEHAADELAARLLEEMPWHGRVLEILWRDMRRAAREGEGLRFRPILLDGGPGVGKTHLALRLAQLAAVPFVYVDLATSSEGWPLSGAQRTWGSSAPGRPVSTILETRVANVLLFVDEVEKGGTHHSHKGGVTTSAHHALLSLLEPASAQVWECPYFGTTFEMSRINWLLAGNDAALLPLPLRSRLRIVPVRGPDRREMLAFAARELARRGLDEEALGTIEALIRAYPEGDERLSLRTVVRLIEDLATLAQTTEATH